MIYIGIDLQEEFLWSHNVASDNVIHTARAEIKRAMRYNYPAMLVEYKGIAKTLPEIRRVFQKTQKRTIVTKGHNDGSHEIIAKAKRLRLDLRHIRVSGVYTDICVRETLEGLIKKLPKVKIKLVRSGCLSCYGNGFRWTKNFPNNIKVI